MNETMTSTEKVKRLVPQLRFGEFDGEFQEKGLGEVMSIFNGYAFSSSKSVPEGCRWVKIADVGINKMKNGSPSFLPKEFKEKHSKFVLRKGDYVVALTRPILSGKLKIAQIDDEFDGALLNQRVGKLKSNNNLDFVYFLLQRNSIIFRIESRIAGTDPPNLSPNEIRTLKTFVPSQEEQQKIATFLSAVDKKIAQLTRKKALLEQYKKGVMQQLFSRQLRFKDEQGRAFLEWEEKRLGDFVLNHKGGAPLKPKDFTKKAGFEVIPKKAIVSGGKLNLDKNNPTYCEQTFFQSYPKSVIDESYLVTTLRDLVPSGPSIGYIVRFKSKAEYLLAQGVYGLKIDETKLSKDWLIQFSNTRKYRKVMQTIMVGSTQVHIRNSEFFKVKLFLPSLSEQQKIANYLSSIDEKINTVTQQITKSQSFKKGLLQQLFV